MAKSKKKSAAPVITNTGGPYTVHDIADWLETTPLNVRTVARDNNLGFRHGAKTRLYTGDDAFKIRKLLRPGTGSLPTGEHERRRRTAEEMLAAGYTKSDIAAALKMSLSSFSHWARRNVPGFQPTRTARSRRPTKTQLAEVQRLHEGGNDLSAIAHAVKLPTSKVADLLGLDSPVSQKPAGPSAHLVRTWGERLASLIHQHKIDRRVNKKRVAAVLDLHRQGRKPAVIASDPSVDLPADVVAAIIERFAT